MKTNLRTMLFTAVVALTANPFALAQTSSNGFEQWYRAKYGRPSATEEARLHVEQANAAQRRVAAPQTATNANAWLEGWYRAKYGRPTPIEEARVQEEQANTAYREVASPQTASSGDTWFEAWYRAKYGRPSPLAEARHLR